MKPLRIFLLLAGLLLASSRAEAQFSISKVTPKEADVKNFRDTIKQLSAVNNQFFSEARYRAEKKRLRKERNTITCTVGLSLNQTGFDNWAPGGNNTFDATASLLYTHVYTRDKLNMTYSFDSKYGMNVISGTTFKNLDYFIFNLNTGWAISKNWSYSASANLRSQWSKGYKSVTEKILVSNFMSPGTLTLGVGFTYRALKKVPLIVTVNPLSGNMQFVLDDSLSRQGAHGVPAGKHQKSSLGSTLRIDLSQPIAGGKMNYITTFMSRRTTSKTTTSNGKIRSTSSQPRYSTSGFSAAWSTTSLRRRLGTARFNGPTKSGSDCPIRSKTSSFGYGNCPWPRQETFAKTTCTKTVNSRFCCRP